MKPTVVCCPHACSNSRAAAFPVHLIAWVPINELTRIGSRQGLHSSAGQALPTGPTPDNATMPSQAHGLRRQARMAPASPWLPVQLRCMAGQS